MQGGNERVRTLQLNILQLACTVKLSRWKLDESSQDREKKKSGGGRGVKTQQVAHRDMVPISGFSLPQLTPCVARPTLAQATARWATVHPAGMGEEEDILGHSSFFKKAVQTVSLVEGQSRPS